MADHTHVIVSKRLVIINSASSLVAKIVNMSVILWMYQYLLKRISADEFAVLPVVTSLMVFAPLFFTFFTSGISRFVVEAYAKGDFDKVTRIISSIFPLLAGVGLIFAALGTLFAFNIDKLLNIPDHSVSDARIMMLLLVLNFAIQMMAMPFLSGFHVRQRYVELNLIGICRDLLRITLLLSFLLGIGPKVIWVVVATTISETVYSLVTVLRARSIVPQLKISLPLFSWTEARQLTGFGLWTTLGRLGNMMYTSAATILLNLYGTPVDVTSYYLGATFYRQISSTVALASQPLQPALTAMHALKDRSRMRNTVLRGGRYALWVTLSVATPLTIYAASFIKLYAGEEYSQAAVVITLFMIIFPFTSPTAMLAMAAMAMAEVRVFFLPAFLFQLAGLCMMAGLLSWTDTGAVGLTFSLSFITVASQLLYYWRLSLKLTGASLRDFVNMVLIPGFMPAICGAVVWFGLNLIKTPSDWTTLLFYCVSGGAIYILVLFTVSLNKDERRDLAGLRERIQTRFRSTS
ncbi:lipopolysaccharide biosynthesis protein [Primorskyibacter sp. 2E233]|uniref:lipopolysaccharide biosynthesis protein n=1 Tax=Primorskyibacter sp. 2E233 TaxID=3413431 RepID=UPI003BF36C11